MLLSRQAPAISLACYPAGLPLSCVKYSGLAALGCLVGGPTRPIRPAFRTLEKRGPANSGKSEQLLALFRPGETRARLENNLFRLNK